MINLLGSQKTAKYFVPLLKETRDGPQVYVVVTSLAGMWTNSAFTSVAYNVSKIAVNRMTEHIHNDHNQKDGIQAFAIHPGAVVTPQTELHSTEKGDAWEKGKCLGRTGNINSKLTLVQSCQMTLDCVEAF
jgi:NAD(P)-dependent dehydrogenase (short-subunit alcohol dehydrogenase family)